MLDTTQLVKDVGTMLEGPEAVKEGLIDEVGGMKEALGKLYDLIGKEKANPLKMKNYTFFGKNIRKTGEFYFTNLSFCAIVL